MTDDVMVLPHSSSEW